MSAKGTALKKSVVCDSACSKGKEWAWNKYVFRLLVENAKGLESSIQGPHVEDNLY